VIAFGPVARLVSQSHIIRHRGNDQSGFFRSRVQPDP
jgi:hypothetical protein